MEWVNTGDKISSMVMEEKDDGENEGKNMIMNVNDVIFVLWIDES